MSFVQSTHKAAFIDSFPGSIVVKERDTPFAGIGEIKIKVESAALNPIDYIQSTSPWSFVSQFPGCPEKEQPLIVGSDVAGTVEQIGKWVTTFQVGDRVIASAPFGKEDGGAFQQISVVPANFASKIPHDMSFTQASSIPLTFITAGYGLYFGTGMIPPWDKGGLNKYAGQPIVIYGGSTSTGQYAIQLAKLSGFSPIFAACSPTNANLVKSLGADHVLPRAATNDDIVKVFTHSIHLIFDCYGRGENTVADGYDILSSGGRFITVSPGAIFPEDRDDVHHTTMSGTPYEPGQGEFGKDMYAGLQVLLEEGKIVPNNVEIVSGGLYGIQNGLESLSQVSGKKLVVKPWDVEEKSGWWGKEILLAMLRMK